ncbi:MAG: GNAT family N-acetyltransferase [Bacteroidales bacterium]|nr:MAG: GNAT family N-acetyltransferase [Bacteroidales bacterium]
MKINNLDIRPASISQIPLVLKLIKELAVYEKLLDIVETTEEDLEDTLFGKNKAAEVVIGYYRDKPVGYALFFYNYSSFVGRPGLYIEDIYVRQEHRGKGFGKAFLIYLARIARERKCGRMEWAVLDWNEPSIEFYKRLGATAMDEWTVFRLSRDAIEKLADK